MDCMSTNGFNFLYESVIYSSCTQERRRRPAKRLLLTVGMLCTHFANCSWLQQSMYRVQEEYSRSAKVAIKANINFSGLGFASCGIKMSRSG